MRLNSTLSPTRNGVVAALLVGCQALVAVLMALALLLVTPGDRLPLFASSLANSREVIALGLAFGAFALCLIAFALASMEEWARPAAILAEVAVILASLFRSLIHPVWSVLGVALAASVLVLLLTDVGWEPRDDDESADKPEQDDVASLAMSGR